MCGALRVLSAVSAATEGAPRSRSKAKAKAKAKSQSQSQSLVSRKPVRAAETPRALPWLLWERLQPRDLDLCCRSETLAAEAAPTAMRVGPSTPPPHPGRQRHCHLATSPNQYRRRARAPP